MAVKKLKASVEFRIEFYDIDSMQVAYHGNYVKPVVPCFKKSVTAITK